VTAIVGSRECGSPTHLRWKPPIQDERVDYIDQEGALLHQKDAWAVALRVNEFTEVSRHRPPIRRDQNPTMPCGQGQYVRIRQTFQICLVR
jgi:hypothetical protein